MPKAVIASPLPLNGLPNIREATAPTTADTSRYRNRIVTGDCISVLGRLPSTESYDVIIADPPYNIGKDFGNNNDTMPLASYVGWTSTWVECCFKHMHHHSVMYIYGFPEILAHVAVRFPIQQQRWLVWHYTNKTVPTLPFWQRSHESILCLWKDRRPSLEIDQIREPYLPAYLKAAGRERRDTHGRYSGNGNRTTYNAHENGALPRDVLKVPALAGGAGRRERWFVCRTCNDRLFPPKNLGDHRYCDTLKHPTQKPLELTKRLIRSRLQDAARGRVLIPFSGSGSECVMAQALGHDFLGIELNPEFARFARQWLKQADPLGG